MILGLSGPEEYRVERGITLAASPDQVYEQVRLLANQLTSPLVLIHPGAAWDDVSRVQRLARACQAGGVRRVVHVSALAVADDAPSDYLRSKAARMEESDFSATAYDRVYEAARPELFFKALPEKVVGPGEPVGLITYMRTDAVQMAPEGIEQARRAIVKNFGADYNPDNEILVTVGVSQALDLALRKLAPNSCIV